MQEIIWILLIIVILIVVYIIYRRYFSKAAVLTNTTYLNTTSGVQITNDQIVNPTSANFSLSVWVYVNSWNNDSLKYVYLCGNNDLSLYFDKTRPILLVDINTSSSLADSSKVTTETVQITDNFPLQKWVYVIVSVNGNYVDCYLDGKLITSYQMQNPSLWLTKTSTWSISMGSGFDAYAYNFSRVAKAMTPQQAQSNYWSSGPKTNSALSSYGVNVDLVKDGTVQSTLTLF